MLALFTSNAPPARQPGRAAASSPPITNRALANRPGDAQASFAGDFLPTRSVIQQATLSRALNRSAASLFTLRSGLRCFLNSSSESGL